METTLATQLKELKGEIDVYTRKIDAKEKKRDETSDDAERAVILESIERLELRLDARSATRDALLLAAAAGAALHLVHNAAAALLHTYEVHTDALSRRSSRGSTRRRRRCRRRRLAAPAGCGAPSSSSARHRSDALSGRRFPSE